MPAAKDSLKTLSTIARILQKSAPEENPLAHIVGMVREQMRADVCSLYLLQGRTLILVATDGLHPSSVGKVRMGIHEGLTGLAIEKLQPVVVSEASRHPRFKFFPETGEEKYHSFAAVPILDREKIIGAMTLQTVQPRDFLPDEIELLRLIAFQLAGVILNLVTLETFRVGVEGEGRSLQMKGIAVAPGFGVGPAFFLRPGVAPVIVPAVKTGGFDPSREWKKLRKAIREASADLLRLEKRLQKKFSRHESDIFYSHRMILSDRSFLKKLRQAVRKGKGAMEAVAEVIGEYIRSFEKIEDPYFRERAADLDDLRQRITDHLIDARPRKKEKGKGILLAETLVPSDTARLDPERIRGIITSRGGATSHAAILARSLGIPAVMGIHGVLSRISPGDLVIVDGNTGNVFVNPPRPILKEYERVQEEFAGRIVHLQRLADLPAQTRDGRRIRLEANVGLLSGLKKIRQYGAEGIGLYRTEFPFMMRKKLPDEEDQFEIYRQILEEADRLPVTFRLLDAGGDKPIESLGLQKEANPFLGYRSIRLSLSRPDLLKTQLRALLRVSALGPIRILVPMISGIEEIRAVKKLMAEAVSELAGKPAPGRPAPGEPPAGIPLGVMVEVPSAVAMAGRLIKECDFFSIGTNDLIQYTLAVDRSNENVARFYEPLHPAVLNAIALTVKAGEGEGKPVSICGEMAGDPHLTPLLVGLGVTGLSMIPSNIPLVKGIIRDLDYSGVREMAQKVLQSATVEEVKSALQPYRLATEKLLG